MEGLKPRDQRYYSQTWIMFNHKLCRMERPEITLRIFPSWRWTSWCHNGKKYDLQAWINKPSWAPKIQWKMCFQYIVSTPMISNVSSSCLRFKKQRSWGHHLLLKASSYGPSRKPEEKKQPDVSQLMQLPMFVLNWVQYEYQMEYWFCLRKSHIGVQSIPRTSTVDWRNPNNQLTSY